jgi:hypothetical protein
MILLKKREDDEGMLAAKPLAYPRLPISGDDTHLSLLANSVQSLAENVKYFSKCEF